MQYSCSTHDQRNTCAHFSSFYSSLRPTHDPCGTCVHGLASFTSVYDLSPWPTHDQCNTCVHDPLMTKCNTCVHDPLMTNAILMFIVFLYSSPQLTTHDQCNTCVYDSRPIQYMYPRSSYIYFTLWLTTNAVHVSTTHNQCNTCIQGIPIYSMQPLFRAHWCALLNQCATTLLHIIRHKCSFSRRQCGANPPSSWLHMSPASWHAADKVFTSSW